MGDLVKVALNSLCLISIFSVIIFLINESYVNKFPTEYDAFKYYLGNEPVDYLFVGSSHTENAINPSLINGAHSLSAGGESYFLTSILKKGFFSDLEVRNLVLEVDPHSFASKFLVGDLRNPSVNIVLQGENSDDLLAEASLMQRISIFATAELPIIGRGRDFFVSDGTAQHPFGWSARAGNFSTLGKEVRLARSIA